jgi:transcriptional regulator with XRE-family HTH domain
VAEQKTSNIAKSFANRLEYFIKQTGIGMDELAKKTGISRNTLYLYRRNKAVPGLDSADQIARAFKMSLVEFLGGGEGHDLAECARRVHAHVDPAYESEPQTISVGEALDIVREELRKAASGELLAELEKLGIAESSPANKKAR